MIWRRLDCSSGKAGRCGNKGNRENTGGLPQVEERKRLRLHRVVRQGLHDPNELEDSSAAQPAGAEAGTPGESLAAVSLASGSGPGTMIRQRGINKLVRAGGERREIGPSVMVSVLGSATG